MAFDVWTTLALWPCHRIGLESWIGVEALEITDEKQCAETRPANKEGAPHESVYGEDGGPWQVRGPRT